MNINVEYLAGLEISPKDKRVHILKVPIHNIGADLLVYLNNVLLALQEHEYEIVGVQAVNDLVVGYENAGVWITYK